MKVEDFIIDENAPLIDAMKMLDKTGQRILFIAPNGKLSAAITDGDLRKAILAGGDLQSPIANAANYSPFSLSVSERAKAKREMLARAIDAVPLLDKEGCIIDVVFANDFDIDTRKKIDLPVVIMAGGLGTRLYPYTKILPKPLIPIGDNPIVEHIIGRFRDFGCTDFHMIVNYRKSMIKSYFSEIEKDYNINFVDEEKPLGTGGGLSLMRGTLKKTFFFSNCDTIIDADYSNMYRTHKDSGNLITMVCAMKNIVIPYGVVELGEDGEIANITEKPEMNFLTNTGLYIVEPSVLQDLKDDVSIGFPDVFKNYHEQGQKVGIYPVRENSWMDMGQLEELENMRRRMEER